MFSYRHGFHAGNHADVLKHFILVEVLRHLTAKDKPLWVIDTHAGAGEYDLEHGFAAKSAEFHTGIAPFWQAPEPSEVFQPWLNSVRALNPDGVLRRYPGSPRIALDVLRPQDKLWLFELHPTESTILDDFSRRDARVSTRRADGFTALKSLLPPHPRRALVLIDPSYEDKHDYNAVVTSLTDALRRFATGTYLVWAPLVLRPEALQLGERLRKLAPHDWLDASLHIKSPPQDGIGLYGSRMFVFNPPWKLETTLAKALPEMVRRLGQDASARYTLDYRQT